VENTTAKQKSCGENIVAIYSVILKKTTKLNSQPVQYKKNWQRPVWKNKEIYHKKKERKSCREIL
jgi:hypothetical protein